VTGSLQKIMDPELEKLRKLLNCTGILEQSMGLGTEQNRIWMSYLPARLHRLVESIPGLVKVKETASGRT
jgi:hypothetical protein